MTKYSTALKIEVVSKYLALQMAGLGKEYGIDYTAIRSWVELVREHGLVALRVKHVKQK